MRGKECVIAFVKIFDGITPAYAGKSPPAERSGPIRWDHPRVCGEKMDAATIQSGNAGSPPRMRGKDRRAVQGGIPAGITPAYAGKSPVVRERFLPAQDHPRVCGEKRSAGLGGRDGLGSPPRMRGKDRKDTDDAGIERITPAYAGKRQPDGQRRQLHRDHPRVCGEKTTRRPAPPTPPGSPPRMRGKVTATPANAGATGITPAYAGKRKFKPKKTTDDWDHPRVCGEKYQDKNGNKRTAGITPAYAGKSAAPHGFRRQIKDHPRVCGEKFIVIKFNNVEKGSPPRMRGKVQEHREEIWEKGDHPRVCGEK